MDYFVVGLIGVLSFSLQLLATKTLLPLLGGSAQVWIGSLLFFQGALFVSYTLNYFVIKDKKKLLDNLILVALGINGASLLLGGFIETPWPLLTQTIFLTLNYGLIFMALLLISPQLQLQTNRRAFNFYVVSNLGSLIGLLLYPFIIEPFVGLQLQKISLIIGAGIIALWFRYKPLNLKTTELVKIDKNTTFNILWWSALGTILLGSFSYSLIQDIISFPLLWVLPLIIYLATFTWAFGENPRGMNLITKKQIPILEIFFLILLAGVKWSTWVDMGLSLIIFTLILLVVQANLVKTAPQDKSKLPFFYLLIGGGGVIGGLIVNLLVPLLFTRMNEYLFFTGLLLGFILWLQKVNSRRWLSFGVIVVLFLALTGYKNSFLLETARGFYGSIHIVQQDQIKSMFHGQIVHGQEDQAKMGLPNTYYQPLMVEDLFSNPRPQKILIIGLGAGVLLHYLKGDQEVDIIEIDPLVINLARKHFSFINNNQSKQKFIIGDGRRELERLTKAYDLIIVDAFSGDSIPIHLITKEAFNLYGKHLSPQGKLGIHLSNTYLDLSEVVKNTAESSGFQGSVETISEDNIPATWGKFTKGKKVGDNGTIWTDNLNSLWPVIKWNK